MRHAVSKALEREGSFSLSVEELPDLLVLSTSAFTVASAAVNSDYISARVIHHIEHGVIKKRRMDRLHGEGAALNKLGNIEVCKTD